MDQIDRLERLAKLRADGALTEEEYQAQKAIVLQSAATSPSPAPSPSMGPAASAPVAASSPSAGGVIEGPPPKNRNAQILMASLGLLAVVLLAAIVAWRFGPLSMMGGAKPGDPGSVAVVTAQSTSAAQSGPDPTKEQAFALVYSAEPTPVTVEGEKGTVKFKPLLLNRLDDKTYVLLSVGEDLDSVDECESCGGVYSIAYFTRSPDLKLQGVPFVRWGRTVGWGHPPELALLKTIGPTPMVLVRNLQMVNGESEATGQLVLLGPTISDVSIVADDLFLEYDDSGAEGHCAIEGRIRPGTPGQSFIMRYTGNFTGDIVYTWSGKTYQRPPNTPYPTAKCPPNLYSRDEGE